MWRQSPSLLRLSPASSVSAELIDKSTSIHTFQDLSFIIIPLEGKKHVSSSEYWSESFKKLQNSREDVTSSLDWVSRRSYCCYFSSCPKAEPRLLTWGSGKPPRSDPPIWSGRGCARGSGGCLGWTPTGASHEGLRKYETVWMSLVEKQKGTKTASRHPCASGFCVCCCQVL